MGQLLAVERACLIGHLVSMAFGLAGLLLVMPHPEILSLIPSGQTLFTWSMAGGGVVYIVLGTIAVSIHAYRVLGVYRWLTFLIPAVGLSLTSELLGTSTGFPFGDYSYLSGLGYKIAGLVPFTIPLSWFYLGLSSYLLARSGLAVDKKDDSAPAIGWLKHVAAIGLGALLLTSWDFVLDPAMSQTAMPFWYWHTPGAFFGMPYQNFVGWMGTGAVFMAVAALFWLKSSFQLSSSQLNLPLVVYLGNFAFAMVMSLAAGIWIPVLLGIALGVVPALVCWQTVRSDNQALGVAELQTEAIENKLDLKGKAPSAPVGVTTK
ncbi:MAG: carotenoid biosynthesis protein [Leptolyngbyaceae cyanobacterium SL_7_1]|nr:carotenoid biosynthesis protein [Leptolyngbyaceae cyanobacterium SL_7_1]